MRTGTIRAAVSPKSEQGITDLHRQLQLRGARIELLNATEMAAKSGTSTYPLGLFYPHGGNLNPLAYAYGLADAALKAGARIFAGTRATGLTKSGDTWTIATPSGSIRARQVILAGNGYTDGLWPGLRQSIVPVHSSITATAPLPPQIAAEIMPSRSSLYEISSTYTYYRIDADGRFLMGGRGVLRDSANSTDFQELVARAVHLFPALKRAEWQYFWNGRTAMTWDHLPHIHEPTEGLRIGLGYNGRGIAMATAVGNMLAERANGAPAEALDLPVTPVKPIFGHGFWPFAVRTRLAWERLRERTGV
jgi:glycine/D-amino acid oxidase-like deaminating enzyme